MGNYREKKVKKVFKDPSWSKKFSKKLQGWSPCRAHVFAKNITASVPSISWIVPATNGTSWRNRVQTIWSTERGTKEKHSQEFHVNHFRSCLAIGRRNVHQVVHLKEVIPTGVVLPSHSQHIPLKHLEVRHELHPNLLVVCFELNSQLEPNGYNYSIAGRFFGLTVLLAWNSSQIQSRSNGKDYISYYHIWSIYLGTLMDVNNCPVGTFLSIGRSFWVWTEFTKIDGISETVQESSEKYMDGNRREKDGTQREMDGTTRNSNVSKRMRRKWCGRKKLKWTEFPTEFVWTKTFVHWSSRYINIHITSCLNLIFQGCRVFIMSLLWLAAKAAWSSKMVILLRILFQVISSSWDEKFRCWFKID